MLIWGFTAYLLDRLLAMGGWERPWDAGLIVDPPPGAGLPVIDGPDPIP